MAGIELLAAFFMGLVSFASPCIIPMILVYFSTLTGLSVEELREQRSLRHIRGHVLKATAVFVFSFALVFTLVGGFAGTAGKLLTENLSGLSVIGGLFLIGVGLNYMGFLSWFPARLNLMHYQDRLRSLGQQTGLRREDGMLSYAGVFLVGFFFAVVCSHCIAPTLYPTLLYAVAAQSPFDGMLLMLAFSLGLGIPFMLSGAFLGEALACLKRASPHYKLIEFVMGLVLVLFGAAMASGNFMLLSSFFQAVIPWKLEYGM